MEQSKRKLYWTLFSSTFVISAFTVGGGMVIIPLLQKKFVDELKWLEQDEMLEMVAIAQSSPGVMAVNAAIIIGYRLAGVAGALVTVLGTVLPPLITLSLISLAYAWFASNRWVAAALRGMKAGVAAVMADITLKLFAGVYKTKKIWCMALCVLAAAAAVLTEVNIVFIILACGLCGGVMSWLERRRSA